MGYHLYKGKLANLIKDKITTDFGFGTEKERIDYKIAQYEKSKINSINGIIAERNLIISKIKAQISACDRVLKPIEEYFKLYDEIEELAINEIIKPDSEIIINLYKPDGDVLASSNYDSLNKVITVRENQDIVVYLTRQLEKQKELNKWKIIDEFINGKGNIIINGIKINSDIYIKFKYMSQYISNNMILKSDGTPYNFQLNNFGDATVFKDMIVDVKNDISLAKSNLELQLNKLNRATEENQNTLDLIEASKQAILNSNRYFAAKASDEYLKEFKR